MIWLTLAIAIIFAAVIVAMIRRHRDPCGLPRITTFDPKRLPILLLVDESLGILEKPLRHAVLFWNTAVSAHLFTTEPDHVGGSSVPVMRGARPGALAHVDLTLTDDNNGIRWASIKVDATQIMTLPELTWRWALAHELGHILGLAHDEDPNSIMWPKVHGVAATPIVTQGDVAFLREAYKLPMGAP